MPCSASNADFDFRKPVAFDDAAKRRFHLAARRQLQRLAQALGLQRSDFDLRVNKAGIAVSGEVTMHSERIYVQVCQSVLSDENGILFRACAGRRDFSGGPNHFAPLDMLNRPTALARRIRETLHV